MATLRLDFLYESLKKAQLLRLAQDLVFWMPLHRHDESLVGAFQTFDYTVPRISRRNLKPRANSGYRLVMPRVDLHQMHTDGLRQHCSALDFNLMGRLAFVLRLHIVARRTQMLSQRAPMINIQKLQAAADRQNREIFLNGLIDGFKFNLVPLIIWMIGFRNRLLSIANGIYVGTAHQQESRRAIHFDRSFGKKRDRLSARSPQGRNIRLDLF